MLEKPEPIGPWLTELSYAGDANMIRVLAEGLGTISSQLDFLIELLTPKDET